MPAPDRPNRDIKQRSEKRTPLGVNRQKLVLNNLQDSTHQYRWINDVGTRISDALAGGYEFVRAETALQIGVRDVIETNTDLGTGVSQVVERGTGRRAFLMRIDRELFDEDQAAKQAKVDETDNAIRSGNIKGLEGKVRVNPEHKMKVSKDQPD